MNIIISNSSNVPIYEQVKEQLKEIIINRELKPGEMLPGMRTLARDLKVSVITTKRAYNDLEREGYIITIPGRGSFVADMNREMMKEEKYKEIEKLLSEAADTAKLVEISCEELKEILEMFYYDR